MFAAVYRERHITRTGRALFISQSAVGHAIAKLRTLLGDPLFVRAPDGMQPTALDAGMLDVLVTVVQDGHDRPLEAQRFRSEHLFDDPPVCVVSRHNAHQSPPASTTNSGHDVSSSAAAQSFAG